MAKQKLSIKAKAAKAKRDLKYAKTKSRKDKKAENQRKRRAAIKAGKNVKGKDYDHRTENLNPLRRIEVTTVKELSVKEKHDIKN